MNELTKLPYAKWLEETLQIMIDMPVESIAIAVKNNDGTIGTNYYNCSVVDQITFAGFIQQDAMISTLKVNGLVPDSDTEEGNEDCG